MDRAVALCRDGLAKFPNHMSARVTLGWSLLDLGKYDEAQAELEQVLRRAPDNLAAIRGLAQLHERAENAVMLPLDGPGAWPPEPDAIESAAAASTAAVEHAGHAEDEAAVAEPVSSAAASDLIVTGRAPAVDVPAEFAPVALTSPAEMTSAAVAVSTPQQASALEARVEAPAAQKSGAGKRTGFLPIQIEPTKVVRPQIFESILDDEMPAPIESPASRTITPQPAAQVAAPVVEVQAVEPVVAEAAIVETARVEPVIVEPVIDEPAVTESAIVATPLAGPFLVEAVIDDEPAAALSEFAQASEPILDEPIAAVGLTGFAGAEFALEPVLDDYVAPVAEAPVAEFALSADAAELQQLLTLEDVPQLHEHAEAQPQFEAIVDEPVFAAADAVSEIVAEPQAAVVEAVAEVAHPEVAHAEIAQTEVGQAEVGQAEVAQAGVAEAEAVVDDPFAFRLTEPVAMDTVVDTDLEAAEEFAGVPEGVLAFDFETPAPVIVVESAPAVEVEAPKPVLAEVVSLAARRHAKRLVALERFLTQVESRRVEIAAQPLAG